MKNLLFLLLIGTLFSCVDEKEKRLSDIINHSFNDSFNDSGPDYYDYFINKIKKDLIDKKIFYFNPDFINNAMFYHRACIMYPTQDTCIVVYGSLIIFPYTKENTKQSMAGFFKLVLAKQETGWELAYTLNKNANTTDTVYCAELCMQWGIKTYTIHKQVMSFMKNGRDRNIIKALLRDNPNPDCIYCDKAQIERLLKRKYWFDE